LVPHWFKYIEQATEMHAKTLNAKSGIFVREASFVKALESQHCCTFSARFKLFRIKVAIKPLISYNINQKKYSRWLVFLISGEILKPIKPQKSVAIITTETNPLMSEIYNIKKPIPEI
jgi:putative SOS response-associated peptidase YedK